MQRRNALAFTFVFALGWSLASAAGADRADARPGTAGLGLATSRLGLESGADQAAFDFARLRDLWVRVTLAGAPNPVQMRLRLIDPQGTLIYESSVAYTSDPAITTMVVPGARHSVAVFQAVTHRDGVMLDYALPVSGSAVLSHLSEGTWTLVAEAGGRTFTTPFEVRTGR